MIARRMFVLQLKIKGNFLSLANKKGFNLQLNNLVRIYASNNCIQTYRKVVFTLDLFGFVLASGSIGSTLNPILLGYYDEIKHKWHLLVYHLRNNWSWFGKPFKINSRIKNTALNLISLKSKSQIINRCHMNSKQLKQQIYIYFYISLHKYSDTDIFYAYCMFMIKLIISEYFYTIMAELKSNNQQQLPLQNPKQNAPQTYFDLIQIVGSKGKYQFNMFLIFCAVLFVAATMLLNTSFLFLNKQFDCKNKGLLASSCQQHVCSLNQDQWEAYLVDKQEGLKSAATQFGPFVCGQQFYVDLSKSCVYFGSFVGLIVFSSISDNYGRKTILVMSMSLATIGSYIVSLSQNFIMLSLGLICSGAGINTASATIFLFFPQVVENNLRQKYTILVQIAYTLGGMTIVGLYYLIGNWRIISIMSTTIPISITLFLIVTYVEQTPQFLLKKSNDIKAALKSLNRIGKINYKIAELITEQNINYVKQLCYHQSNINQNAKRVIPLDLIRYSSLRSTTICLCLLGFITLSMYYGPIIIIESIGFNIFISSFVVQLSQLITFLPSYYYVEQIKRQKAGIITYIIASICSILLIFVTKPEGCNLCIQSIIELIIVFVFRFAIAFYFIIFLMYAVQLFPSSASGIGNGFVTASGSIGSTLNPIVLGYLKRLNISGMNLFSIYGIIGICLASLLRQTQGKQILPQIQQVQAKNVKNKVQTDKM